MWKFYLRALRGLPSALLDSLKRTEGGIGVAFLVLLLINKPLGQKYMNWDGGISPWWSLVPAGVLLLWSALKANHTLFVDQGVRYESEIRRLVASGAVPSYDATTFKRAWASTDKTRIEERINLLASQIRDFLVANGPRLDGRHLSQVSREFKLIFEEPIMDIVKPLVQDDGWVVPSVSIYAHLSGTVTEYDMDGIVSDLRSIRRKGPEDEDAPF